MKNICFSLFSLALLSSHFMHGETPFVQELSLSAEKDPSSISSYLQDLEDLGYCIIPHVLSQEETEKLYDRVWTEFIEKAWPLCKKTGRDHWKEFFPNHGKLCIFAGPAGQTQVMWDLRQDPRILEPFAQIWNTYDLIVSMDGMSFMCPIEIREEGHDEPWPHVDQTILRRKDNFVHSNSPPIDFISESFLKTKPFTVQGQFLFEDSFEGDGGFFCIPKSHLRFDEFALHLGNLHSKDRKTYLKKLFSELIDTFGNRYEMKHITAPKGSLILWDSRTVHWNQRPSKERHPSNLPKVRMVGYLCYVPKARLTDEGKRLRRQAFELGVSTGHNPAAVELKYTKDHIGPGCERYLEDPSYVQPTIHLTEIGQSLLGF